MKKSKQENYSNLLGNIKKEQKKFEKKDYKKIERSLTNKHSKAKYIRQSISVTEKEVKLGRELMKKLAIRDEFVNKSQLYRAGLALLQKLTALETKEIIRELTD